MVMLLVRVVRRVVQAGSTVRRPLCVTRSAATGQDSRLQRGDDRAQPVEVEGTQAQHPGRAPVTSTIVDGVEPGVGPPSR